VVEGEVECTAAVIHFKKVRSERGKGASCTKTKSVD
jgi:hypothetical protein